VILGSDSHGTHDRILLSDGSGCLQNSVIVCILSDLDIYSILGFLFRIYRSRDNAIGIATGYELEDPGVRVRVPVGSRIVSSPSRPTVSEVHPASCPMGTGDSFPGGKAAGACS
jgi:hypothetical protein